MRPKKQQAPVKKTAAQQERREKLKSIHAKRESLDALNNGSVLVEKEVSIEIGDSIDYIIIYSDLQIEEEF